MRPEGAGMELGGCEKGLPEESRREHWQLLGNLKTTVEGLVSANSPNVWSKYGGLERLCRDMQSILHHGLIHDQVCCRQTDYWQFVKDIRWLSPHSALHVEKFISLHENGQSSTDGVSERAVAELWLQHSLQCHCLSAQLRPLLGDRQYIRKFYTDTAFLLSDAHVTAMLQCLEAVEQNNPRLLAQIDASMFARKHESPLLVTKSQSLTALPGSAYTPSTNSGQHSYFGSFSSLHQIPHHSLERRSTSFSLSGPPRKPQESRGPVSAAEDQTVLDPLLPITALAKDSPSTPNEMSSSTLTSPLEASWVSSQNDSPSDASEGPEYLAIGNQDPRGRTASCQSHSSNTESSSSNLFSSSSSQKPDSAASSLGDQEGGRQSQLSSVLRRSSFSEGQTLTVTGGTKKSHTRSHSDTNIASRGAPESCSDKSKLRGPLSYSGQSSEVSTPSSLYMEYEGSQYLCSGEGMFRRPSEGQSLISYLSEQDFGSCADLEKENAHFSISESLIAAIELMKCNMMSQCLEEEEGEEDSDREIQELKQKIRLRRQQIRTKNLLPGYQEMEHGSFRLTSSSSQFSSRDSAQFSDSGSADDEVDEFEIQDADIRRSTPSNSKSFISSQSFSHCFLHSTSAEAVAMGLLKQFEGMQLPAASELEWLVPEHDAPQPRPAPVPPSLPPLVPPSPGLSRPEAKMAAAAAGAASAELVIGWCIFGLLLLAILAFCWIYVRKYQSQRESEVVSTITAIFSLAIALITSALLPVDIFLVSYMKNQNGTFKDWANANVSRQIEDTVLYGYYTLYSVILFCVFFWIPFVYFYYEEKDDDDTGKCTQVKMALKYTLGFVVICALLLLVGAFVPLNLPDNKNSTEWEKVKFLFEELGSSHGLAALSFSISSLTLVGMLAAIIYTAYGMSALPLNLIKGTRNAAYERLENTEDIEEVEQHIQTIKSKSKDGRPLPARDRRALKQFEERLRTLRKRERRLEFIENSWWTKFCGALRPLKIIWGIFFIFVALLFVISLFLSNLDKALHSAGIDSGFIIFGANLSNPLNMLLPLLQTVFPLDYILITIIIMYFIFTSMAGIRNIGIWFFWIRLYKIRRGRTRPQALLFLCMILLLIVLHTSYMIYSLAPQYVMYGSQNYLIESNMTYNDHRGNSSLSVPKRCDADAPEDQCTVTRTYLFLHKFWFFSAAYYFGNWAFLGVFIVGFIVSCCKGKKSVLERVDEDDSDLSDDEPSLYSV